MGTTVALHGIQICGYAELGKDVQKLCESPHVPFDARLKEFSGRPAKVLDELRRQGFTLSPLMVYPGHWEAI
jgi:hypothetical protein